MKKLLLLIFILLACLAAGCLTSDSGGDDDDERTGGSYTVSGKVVDSSGAGISGVLITLTGMTAEKSAGENVNLSVSTNSDGSYSFQNINNGTYVLTAVKSGLEIEPSSRTVQVLGSNVSVANFTGSTDAHSGDNGNGNGGEAYTVYGSIIDSSGNGISDVSVSMVGGGGSFNDITDAGGNYSLEDVSADSYTIIPVKSDYTFTPEYRTVIVSDNNVPVGAFVGSTESGGGDNGGGDNGGGDTGSGNAGSHTYFPLKEGATWTYHVTDTEVETGESDEFDYTTRISGTEVIDGKEYWVMTDDDDEYDGYTRIEDGIVYIFGGNDVITKTATMLAKKTGAGKIAEDFNPFDSEIPMIDLNASAGQTFEIMDFTQSESGVSMTTKMSGKYIGTANISTAAGSFSNCRHYELTTEYSMSSEFYSFSTTSTSQSYLAPNVGLVKSTDNMYEDGKLMWIYDEDLVSYSIP